MISKLTRILQIGMLALATMQPSFAAETLVLDPEHTYVLWHIQHLGFSTQAGKWYAKGSIIFDEAAPEKSKVDVIIDVANVITGIPELDKHLKGKLFFDTATFPVATFISNNVVMINKTAAKVNGTLTLHGIAKPVSLMVTLNKTGANPINNRMTTGFTATTSIKRSDFGIKTLLPQLGDDVFLEINAEAYRPEASRAH